MGSRVPGLAVGLSNIIMSVFFLYKDNKVIGAGKPLLLEERRLPWEHKDTIHSSSEKLLSWS